MATDRYRQQIDWQKLLDEMQDIAEQRDQYLPDIQDSKLDLRRYNDYLNGFRCEALFDLWSVETQCTLQSFHVQLTEAFTLLINTQEKDKDDFTFLFDEPELIWLAQTFETPRTFLALYTTGFSWSLMRELEGYKFYPNSQALFNPQGQDAENSSSVWETWSKSASDFQKGVGVYATMNDFLKVQDIQDSKIFSKIARGHQNLEVLLNAFGQALLKGTKDVGVSTIAQSSSLLLSALPKTFNSHQLKWMIVAAEKMAQGQPLTIAKTFQEQMQQWQ